MTSSEGLDLTIRDDMWQDVRGDRTLLKSSLWLNGVPLHLEAVAVSESVDGMLSSCVEEDEDRLSALEQLYAARWTTLEIAGPGGAAPRPYVLYAVPFAD